MSKVGARYEHVGFEKQTEASDGGGGVHSIWEEQFTRRATYVHLRGGESVMAGRLAGKHTQVITVDASSDVSLVDTTWRIRDKRTDELYNIRDREPDVNRFDVHFTCERGVAT